MMMELLIIDEGVAMKPFCVVFGSLILTSLIFITCKESTAPEPQPVIEDDTEFLINTLTEGDQTNPQVVALDDGNFVVVWRSKTDEQNYLLKGQLFTQEGLKLGSEFYVTVKSNDRYPYFKVISILDGFYVQWWYFGYDDTYLNSISFDVYGYRLGPEVRYDTGQYIDFRKLDTALLTDNDIITVYCPVNENILCIIWDPTGQTAKDHKKLVTEECTTSPKVCYNNDSTFVVVWENFDPPNEKEHLKKQIFLKNGTPESDPITIISYDPELLYPSVLPIELGYKSGYLVLWISGFSGRLMGQYFDQQGEYLSEQTMMENVSTDYQLFKTDPNFFTIIDFGVNLILNEYKVDPHIISNQATVEVTPENEGATNPGNGAKVSDEKIIIVWSSKYSGDYDIFGKLIDF
jgi:hypothetical protein